MPWEMAFAHWATLGPALCREFRYLDTAAIGRFRGDYGCLVGYMADTHDLTLAEAEQALQDWLTFRATIGPMVT